MPDTMPDTSPMTGGCQCGAVRYAAGRLGRASICHCRMCQKAFGSFFGPLVTADLAHLHFTRGQPKWYRSSNKVSRGFCEKCGTPLAYRHPEGIEIAIGTFDHPEMIEPAVQVNVHQAMPWIKALFDKPELTSADHEAFFASIESWQHPDHDTAKWPEDET